MREPSVLIPLDSISYEEKKTIALMLDEASKSNIFTCLFELFGDRFIAFLDVFQEDEFKMPDAEQVTRLALCARMAYDVEHKGLSYSAKKYKRTKDTLTRMKLYVDEKKRKGESFQHNVEILDDTNEYRGKHLNFSKVSTQSKNKSSRE